MKFITLTRIALASATLAAASAHAAPLQNGSFNAGLSNWTTIGDVAVVTGSAVGHDFGSAPTLVLGTASASQEDDGAGNGAYNISGTSAAMAGQPNGAEMNLGLLPGALDATPGTGDATEASSIAQSFFLNAGDTIRFSWQVLTRDAYAGNGDNVNDTAWVAFSLAADPQQAPTITQTQLGNVGTLALSATGTDGWRVTGWNTFTFTATTGGTARLGWAVNDALDITGTTLLAIQNVSVQSAVPEPASVALLLAALGVIGLSTLRRRNQG